MTDTAHTPDPVDLHVGAKVRERRKSLGISQERLAQAIGLTFQQVQKYERGSNRISASKLYAIAAFLGTPIETFFAGLAPIEETEGLPDVAEAQAWLRGDDALRLALQVAPLPKPARDAVVKAGLNIAAAFQITAPEVDEFALAAATTAPTRAAFQRRLAAHG